MRGDGARLLDNPVVRGLVVFSAFRAVYSNQRPLSQRFNLRWFRPPWLNPTRRVNTTTVCSLRATRTTTPFATLSSTSNNSEAENGRARHAWRRGSVVGQPRCSWACCVLCFSGGVRRRNLGRHLRPRNQWDGSVVDIACFSWMLHGLLEVVVSQAQGAMARPV